MIIYKNSSLNQSFYDVIVHVLYLWFAFHLTCHETKIERDWIVTKTALLEIRLQKSNKDKTSSIVSKEAMPIKN